MGLMNIGKKEGSQIIQLFGRGIRLKGHDFCLKRSRRIAGLHAPKEIERLETLHVFGNHADYMRQFKEHLEDEGLPTNVNKAAIHELLTNHDCYVLYIPKEDMEARSFEQVRRWQEIASTLLRKYCDRLYKNCRAAFEKEHLEYSTLTEDDPNFIDEYMFLIDQSR